MKIIKIDIHDMDTIKSNKIKKNIHIFCKLFGRSYRTSIIVDRILLVLTLMRKRKHTPNFTLPPTPPLNNIHNRTGTNMLLKYRTHTDLYSRTHLFDEELLKN